MQISRSFSEYTPWSGAVDTYNTIREANKLDALESYFDELYPDSECIDETTVNDILWFEPESVFEYLGIGFKCSECGEYITDEDEEFYDEYGLRVCKQCHEKLEAEKADEDEE